MSSYTIKAICSCKDNSEKDLVVAVRQSPMDGWGCLVWSLNIFLLIITLGGWLAFLGGWMLASYLFFPKYKCQFCNKSINNENIR